MIMDDVFFWFVHNFGDYSALLRFNVAAIDGPFLDVVITFTVQSVYCWRLRKIGQWKILPIVTAMVSRFGDCFMSEIDTADEQLSLVSCVGGMIAGIHVSFSCLDLAYSQVTESTRSNTYQVRNLCR